MQPPSAPSLPIPDSVLRTHRAFGLLGESNRQALAASFRRERFAAGAVVVTRQTLEGRLGLVLSGHVCLQADDAPNTLKLGPGDLLGVGLQGIDCGWSCTADGSTELAWLPARDVADLCRAEPLVGYFFGAPVGNTTRTDDAADPHLNLMTTPVRALLKRPPITLPPTATILQTAQLMREERVSSVLLIEQEHLFGLVTDRDLRNRALAQGLDSGRPVLEIATVAPMTVDIAKPAFEALLLMARHNIHHVPVLDGQRVVGMITATDLTEQHSTSAVYLVGDVYKQTTVEALVAVSRRIKPMQRNLAAAEASAYSTGHVVTAVTDSLTARLLQLGEARLGPPPVDYAWVAAGSQARNEQTAKSDQDNCMVLDDSYDEAQHGAYFQALARFVNDGLDACGYIYCPGEMMARTDEWRQPQRRWLEYFRRWTESPDPKALMLTCVFFDLRAIYGRTSLLADLRREVLKKTRDNQIFLVHMASNALSHRPPLSLFGGISTIRSGAHRDTVDLKHSGIVPIVDLARVYALAGGHDAVNTHERLAVAADSKEISEQGARDLRDALEFTAGLRIRHQARQMAEGQAADNFLALDELSNFERSQLKSAFGVVQTLQSVLSQRYTAGRF